MMGRSVPVRSAPRRVTGRLKHACDLVIWGDESGLPVEWQDAAARAGLRVRTLRLAMQKAHVRQYLTEQRRAFLEGVSAKNISRAVALRDQDMNRMAALGAIKFLEDGGNPAGAAGPVRTPGICIQIIKA